MLFLRIHHDFFQQYGRDSLDFGTNVVFELGDGRELALVHFAEVKDRNRETWMRIVRWMP